MAVQPAVAELRLILAPCVYVFILFLQALRFRYSRGLHLCRLLKRYILLCSSGLRRAACLATVRNLRLLVSCLCVDISRCSRNRRRCVGLCVSWKSLWPLLLTLPRTITINHAITDPSVAPRLNTESESRCNIRHVSQMSGVARMIS